MSNPHSMKKPLLVTALILSMGCYQAGAIKTPTEYANGAFQSISPSGQYAISDQGYGIIVIHDFTNDKSYVYGEDTYSYSTGLGNAVSNNGIVLASTTNNTNAAYWSEGKWIDLNVPNPNHSNMANGITPDGSRICGSIGNAAMNPDEDNTMLVPAYWDRQADGSYGECHPLPHPDLDYTGRAPQYITAISISDDGQGMDPDKILAKAERNGILTKPASDYSKKEILSLLMLPGFSTNEEVTEFSGRGVGMDVVKKNVEAVGGTISITSETGKGSCTTLKIPLTMAITDGMEVSVGKSLFTIPIANIRQSFKPQKEEVILDANGNEIIKCLDAFYPIIRIHELYNIETEVTNIEDGILIWVETADKSYCLFVDELLGEQQVVVKPLSPFLGNFNIKSSGIGGCTILGDGNISLILDISNLYAATQQY